MTEPLAVMGLDLARRTGLAVLPGDAVALSFDTDPTPRGMASFRAFLRGEIERSKPAAVFSEAPAIVKGRTNWNAWAMRGVVMEICGDLNLAWAEISPAEIKKSATGKGNATKDEMVVAARLKFGLPGLTDHNIADALHLADLGRARIIRGAL